MATEIIEDVGGLRVEELYERLGVKWLRLRGGGGGRDLWLCDLGFTV